MLNPLHIIAIGTLLADIVARYGNVAARSFISKIDHEFDPGDEASALELMSGMEFSENGVWTSAGPLFIYNVVDDTWKNATSIGVRTVHAPPHIREIADEMETTAIQSGLDLLDEMSSNSMTKEEEADRDRDLLCKIGSVVPR